MKKRPDGYWLIKKNCVDSAKQCKSKTEWITRFSRAYVVAKTNGWIDICCKHFPNGKLKPKFWTEKKCIDAINKCKTRTEFIVKYPGAYWQLKKNKTYDELTNHIERLGNKYYRLIYAYLFSDKSIYIGLTGDRKLRMKFHLKSKASPVYRHKIKLKENPKYIELTPFLAKEKAAKMEIQYQKDFIRKKYLPLFKQKGGGLGGSTLIYSKEHCARIANKYTSKKKFKKENFNLYNAAWKHGWLIEICSHMLIDHDRYWSKNRCEKETKKYIYYSDFRKKSPNAFQAFLRYKYDIGKHLIKSLNQFS